MKDRDRHNPHSDLADIWGSDGADWIHQQARRRRDESRRQDRRKRAARKYLDKMVRVTDDITKDWTSA